eukprot:TRINITY_DN75783_c0_g1_i1.p1 TRINITY_DN75783_c0_g1~~TRINITY_DN75783_c0_g1_i1.p1  ORF type:complete len:155 (+),score=15.61 TRINITY_DN75783_c0_g1_i1:129-593(+)
MPPKSEGQSGFRVLAHQGSTKVLGMNEVVSKENRLRWSTQDKVRSTGSLITGVHKLPRAHSTIGGHPGHMRSVPLSPRKSAALFALEQRYLKSDTDSKTQATRDKLYEGVSADGQGRQAYLKARADIPLKQRYGRFPQTSSQAYGFGDPWLSAP